MQLYGSKGHTGNQVYPRVIRLMVAGHDDTLHRVAERVDRTVLIEL